MRDPDPASDLRWAYRQRAHLHGDAIGTASLVASLLLVALRRASSALRAAISAALGVGGFCYSIFWLLAGQRAPGLGSTGAAKKAFSWLAVPTTRLMLAGWVALLLVVAVELYGRTRATA
jgi:hypothetical protein